jgi:hypothetical protein
MKLFVITERGRVVGTQPATPSSPEAPITAVLRAGPGQRVHEIDVAAPGALASAKAIEAFHRVVAKSIKPRKAARKKAKKRK